MPRNPGLVLALAALGVSAAIGPAPAAQPPPGGPRPGTSGPPAQGRPGPRFDLLARLSTELKLTEAQKAKIKPILDAQLAQMRTIGTNQSLTPDQKRAKIMALANVNQGKIRKILKPDQQKKWDALLARMRGGQPGAPGGRARPAAPPGPGAPLPGPDGGSRSSADRRGITQQAAFGQRLRLVRPARLP